MKCSSAIDAASAAIGGFARTKASRSSTAAQTTVTAQALSSRKASSTTAMPSGAASRQIAVMDTAPRSTSSRKVVTSVPPVASIGSSTNTSRPVRSSGSRFA